MDKKQLEKYKLLIILIILVIILFITGCTYNEEYEISNNSIYLVDEETCVQYIKFYDYKGISVRLKANGEPMLDKKCLEEKENS